MRRAGFSQNKTPDLRRSGAIHAHSNSLSADTGLFHGDIIGDIHAKALNSSLLTALIIPKKKYSAEIGNEITSAEYWGAINAQVGLTKALDGRPAKVLLAEL